LLGCLIHSPDNVFMV